VAAFAAAFAVYVLLSKRSKPALNALHYPEIVFLLRDSRVEDHTPDATDLFDHTSLTGMSWKDLRVPLLDTFPDLPETLPRAGEIYKSESLVSAQLRVSQAGRCLRLSLTCPDSSLVPVFTVARLQAECDRLTEIASHSPDAVWQTDLEHRTLWYNNAYALACTDNGHDPDGPTPFDMPPPATRAPQTNRASLRGLNNKPHWFEVTSTPMGDGWMHHASSIDNLVNAEMAQRNFVQTLTKTFAHLPTGLAVFDRNRQLVLFNPALVDLTRLPVDFLSTRPNLLSFFDLMRENRMMPEPKNYASWRDKLYDVITAAREDRYAETWNLPSGLTYKITGRPHPDGAVAFLIEDISAEISLTRSFRSELELTQSVIDCFDESVAVFSRLGVLTFSNAAYRAQWKCDPDSAFAEITIVDATRDWANACKPSPIWPDLREFVLALRERTAWEASLETLSGQKLHCTVEPVASGATLVRFSQLAEAPAKVPEKNDENV
jgi:PAS domain-containing protein